ncbi:hypothetical protein Zmor_007133 [Zophobas morio]|uniref:Uncharacterized protein n=1 Tax=Zophobas morio TaxID=2755281 RepID=A0AA38IWT2_9CUCU|nr:hypothetical protein Zmor_007133 [Zophobas morio]
MFAQILSVQYDSYHPDYSLTLVNSLRSYINLKLDHEKKTPEFITDLQRRLYFIHEYNCQVAKVTQEYPQSRQFELLLIKYVELEYDALYSRNPYPSQEVEIAAELRILRLLQVMLYSAVHNNEPLVNKHTDRAVKKAVLQLLGEVKPTYLVKNKLICNIANKLLRRIHGNSKKFHYQQSAVREIHKNLATSDYGSEDSDSDFESNIFSTKWFTDVTLTNASETSTTSDCVEVPLTTDGLAPVPTIEFTDDDDNYFVYLQKRIPTKRKIQDDCKTSHRKKNVSEIASNNINKNALAHLQNLNSKENTKSNKNCKNELNKASEKPRDHDSACVIVCSDSEDEVCEVTLNAETSKKASNNANNDKKVGIVTFEILDDDDDDDQTNYMVYLQKEVETKRKSNHSKEATGEIIICSDTEDESSAENAKCGAIKCSKDSPSSDISLQESSKNKIVPLTQPEPKCILEQSESSLPQNSSTSSYDHLQAFPKENLNKVTSVDFKTNCPKKSVSNGKIIPDTLQASTSKSVNTNSVILNDDHGSLNKKLNTNFLVDPATIFEQINETQLQKNDIYFQNSSAANQLREISVPLSTEAESEANVPGGPLMSEKVETFEDLGNASECRINESLLEEILLDDTYLLEGRKEFEELEYFLFNDNTDRQGFSLSNFSFDDSEMVPQPETFDADIKSLESFLDDSQLISVPDPKAGSSLDSSHDDNGSIKQVNGKKVCNTLYKENCECKAKKSRCSNKNYLKTVLKHTKEINR